MQGPIVFVRIGWMKNYKGTNNSDPLRAENFSFFKNNNVPSDQGHEQWNFAPLNGKVYGYVPRSSGINISRLGATKDSQLIEGITVVFVALDPFVQVLKVVGWYKSATVFRHIQHVQRRGSLDVETSIVASPEKTQVVPVALRSLIIPAAQRIPGGFGQSPLWYAEKHRKVVQAVKKLIKDYDKNTISKLSQPTQKNSPPRSQDPEKRKAVEDFAMNAAMDYFDDSKDVSKQNLGWDVESQKNNQIFKIEVKGLSGEKVHFELTRNEFESMKTHQKTYILFVVTNALTKKARTHIFRALVSTSSTKWVSEHGDELQFDTRKGAIAKIAT